MDRDVQRAILLKALMMALHKTAGIEQQAFTDDKKQHLKGAWFRFNASTDTLKLGTGDYAKTLQDLLAQHGDSLPDDPLWAQIVDFAVHDRVPDAPEAPIPDSLAPLRHWGRNTNRDHTLSELGGLWWVFRLSTKSNAPDEREVTVSLLNIPPRRAYEDDEGEWINFSLFLHPPGEDDFHYRVDGICYPQHLHLHFIGLLDRTGSALPTAMSLHYDPGGRYPQRRARSTGLLFVTNSHSQQVSAPVVAIHIPGSDHWDKEAYLTNRVELLRRLGSFPQAAISDICSRPTYDTLLERSESYLVFETQ